MKKCSKCNIEKELDKFQTYYHSTQQTTRTRGICTECFNQQKVERRKYLKELKDPTKYKECSKCQTIKPIDEFTIGINKIRILPRCKMCYNIEQKEINRTKLINKGGNDRVRILPDQYEDDIQQKNTFEFLQLLGYIYDNGIWIKPGYKEVVDNEIVFNFDCFKKNG